MCCCKAVKPFSSRFVAAVYSTSRFGDSSRGLGVSRADTQGTVFIISFPLNKTIDGHNWGQGNCNQAFQMLKISVAGEINGLSWKGLFVGHCSTSKHRNPHRLLLSPQSATSTPSFTLAAHNPPLFYDDSIKSAVCVFVLSIFAPFAVNQIFNSRRLSKGGRHIHKSGQHTIHSGWNEAKATDSTWQPHINSYMTFQWTVARPLHALTHHSALPKIRV